MKRFTEKHEWVELKGETAIVGISDYAAGELGDITYVELPVVGDTFSQGDSFCVVESVKAASDVYAPVGGVVVAVNAELEDNPGQLNEAAEGAGWICKLGEVNADELKSLMTPEEYADYIAKL